MLKDCRVRLAIEELEPREMLDATLVNLGLASYLQGPGADRPVGTPAEGYLIPQDKNGTPVLPGANTGASFNQIPQTNDWWSSLLWRQQGASNPTTTIYPHPFAVFFETTGAQQGMAVGYPSLATVTFTKTVTDPTFGDVNIRDAQYAYPLKPPGKNLENFGVQIDAVPFTADQLKVEGYGDWSVTASWGNATDRLKVTMGQGMPFLYFTPQTDKEIKLALNVPTGLGNIFFQDNNDGTAILGVPNDNGTTYYGLFGMPGVTWVQNGNTDITTQGLNRQYFSIAMLPPAYKPNTGDAIFKQFKSVAYAEITSTRVTYQYDVSTNNVTTTFAVAVTKHDRTFTDGTVVSDKPILTLYRHQWVDQAGIPLLADSFNYGADNGFAAGLMKSTQLQSKTVEGQTVTAFQTVYKHQGGMLPFLPPGGSLSATGDNKYTGNPLTLSLFDEVSNAAFHSPPAFNPTTEEAYGEGKALLRLANLIPIADQLSKDAGLTADQQQTMVLARDRLINNVKLELVRWFGDGLVQADGSYRTDQYLYYNTNWDVLIPYRNQGFGTGSDLNDAHFWSGYYLHAAGLVALYDNELLTSIDGKDNFGGILKLIARNVADWDRQSPTDSGPIFPFLRNFDPYAGHSYASGHSFFDDGNNQEASSESVNFSIGLTLLGQALANVGDADGAKMVNLGVSLYETEVRAIEQYTFDIDGKVFPTNFVIDDPALPGDHHLTMSAQKWDDGSKNTTFFDTNYAEAPFSIDWLPISAGSLYLGRHSGAITSVDADKSYVQRNWEFYDRMTTAFKDDPTYAGRHPYPVYAGTDFAYEALYDPASAMGHLIKYYNPSESVNHGLDGGESPAFTYRFISTLAQYGYLDSSITATGVTNYAAFRKGDVVTYVAYNSAQVGTPPTVTFSDGTSFTVPAMTMVVKVGSAAATNSPVPNSPFLKPPQTFILQTDATGNHLTKTPRDDRAATDTVLTIPISSHDQFTIPPQSATDVVRFLATDVSTRNAGPTDKDVPSQFGLWLRDIDADQPKTATGTAVAVGVRYWFTGSDTSKAPDRTELFIPSGGSFDVHSAVETAVPYTFPIWNNYSAPRAVLFFLKADGDWAQFDHGTIEVTLWVVDPGTPPTHRAGLSVNTVEAFGRQSYFSLPSAYQGSGVGFPPPPPPDDHPPARESRPAPVTVPERTPPALASVVQKVLLNNGRRQRWPVTNLAVVFNGLVGVKPGAFRLLLQNRRSIPLGVETRTENGRTVVTLTLETGNFDPLTLENGNPVLRIRGKKLRDTEGRPLGGNLKRWLLHLLQGTDNPG